MLLVDHGETEIAEGDALLNQGMRTDRHVDRTVMQAAQRTGTLGRLVATGEQGHAQADGGGTRL